MKYHNPSNPNWFALFSLAPICLALICLALICLKLFCLVRFCNSALLSCALLTAQLRGQAFVFRAYVASPWLVLTSPPPPPHPPIQAPFLPLTAGWREFKIGISTIIPKLSHEVVRSVNKTSSHLEAFIYKQACTNSHPEAAEASIQFKKCRV